MTVANRRLERRCLTENDALVRDTDTDVPSKTNPPAKRQRKCVLISTTPYISAIYVLVMVVLKQ